MPVLFNEMPPSTPDSIWESHDSLSRWVEAGSRAGFPIPHIPLAA